MELEFEKYLMKELSKEVEKATKETEQVLKDQVQKKIYESYMPVKYNRTDNLKDSIVSNVSNDNGEVIFDEAKLNHKSAVTKESIKMVPKLVNYGHKDSTGINNLYHSYAGKGFVEDTINIMQNKEEYKDIIKFEIKND